MSILMNFRLTPEQKQRLDDIAWSKRMRSSEILRKLVDDYVKRESRKQERQEKAVEAR
jgi:predicted transcriptional regulator